MSRNILSVILGLMVVFSAVSLPAMGQTASPLNRPTLRIGSEGVAVSELQAALKLLGYYSGAVDGIYSEATVIAVSRFQQAAGLNPDGIVSSATWERLFPHNSPTTETKPEANSSDNNTSGNNANASTNASLPTLKQGMRGEVVVRLQERLRALGFLRGRADGIFGERTLEAVKAVQARFNLRQDGIVGSDTWRVLLR